MPVFAYYGAGRGVFDVPARKRGFGKYFHRFDALKACLESRTNFRSFVEYFYSLEEIENNKQKEVRSFDFDIPELRAIRSAVSKMVPDFSNPRGAYPAGIYVDWQQEGVKKRLRIEQLSDGYRTTLAMVMDIASRMAEANLDMPDPLQSHGVVMIHEVDLHLHPGWQQTILLDLMRTFPNVQFIVSTHSPQCNGQMQSLVARGFSIGDARTKLADMILKKNAVGHWPKFFTSIRSYLGSEAEAHLINVNFDG